MSLNARAGFPGYFSGIRFLMVRQEDAQPGDVNTVCKSLASFYRPHLDFDIAFRRWREAARDCRGRVSGGLSSLAFCCGFVQYAVGLAHEPNGRRSWAMKTPPPFCSAPVNASRESYPPRAPLPFPAPPLCRCHPRCGREPIDGLRNGFARPSPPRGRLPN